MLSRVLLAVFTSAGLPVLAAESRAEACVGLINSRSASVEARDWPAAQRLSNRYIRECQAIATPQDLSSAYEILAIAQMEQKNRKRAELTARKCIEVWYQAAGCHVLIAELQHADGKFEDALATLDRADGIISFRLSANAREKQTSASKSRRLAFDASDEEMKSLAELSRALRRSAERS